MGLFTGGADADIITPAFVSPGVTKDGGLAPGNGADTLLGYAGADTLDGGRGADSLDGGFGADFVHGGDGDDIIGWSPGGGSDAIDGGKGQDTLLFNTANIAETIGVSAQGGHVVVTRDVANITLDLEHVERIAFTAPGGLGADRFRIEDLAGTGTKQVDVDLGTTPDGVTDIVTVVGRDGGDALVVTAAAGATVFGGLAATVSLTHAESIDRLAVAAGRGDDVLDASALGGGATVNFDGGEDSDLVRWRGGAGGDVVNVVGSASPTAEGKAVYVEMNGLVSQVNLANVESVLVASGDGDDNVRASSYANGPILTIDAGDGADSVYGSAGADSIAGGRGDDLIEGGFATDVIDAGAGDDVIVWSPGGGSDTIDGGKGQDVLSFNTANIGETIGLAAYNGHAILTRDVAGITLDLDNVERIAFGGGGGGADRFFVSGLQGTDVTLVEIGLGVPAGGGDGAADTVLQSGSASADRVVITGGGGTARVTGLSAEVRVSDGEAADRLVIDGLDGADTFDASGFAGGGLGLRLNGGGGADRFVFGPGSARAEAEIVGFGTHAAGADADLIVLNGFADANFVSALANHHISQVGMDVVIDDGEGPIIRLLETAITDLGGADFLFR